jgi:hypothetical protein
VQDYDVHFGLAEGRARTGNDQNAVRTAVNILRV